MCYDEDCYFLNTLRKKIGERIFGQHHVVDAVLVTLICRRHALLEGNPGLAKTTLVKTLAEKLELPGEDAIGKHWPGQRAWGRIQFTPDLLPSDITGTEMPAASNSGQLVFRHGPVFSWLLLADEINRATPKTQSAMLEVMAERQVTVLGRRYLMAHPVRVDGENLIEPPFTVLATQNPIDQEGTYELPEAQADRFLFKILMASPNRDNLGKIIEKDSGLQENIEVGRPPAGWPFETIRKLNIVERDLRQMPLASLVKKHILNIVLATNMQTDELDNVADLRRLKTLVQDYLRFPLGPRAGTALALGAKGFALLYLNNAANINVAQEEGLGRAVLSALRHRLKLTFDWQHRMAEDPLFKDAMPLDQEARRDRLIAAIVTAATPKDRKYETHFTEFFSNQINQGSG